MVSSIVGKSGAGKSYISNVFESYSKNIKHLNVDEIGHQVLLLEPVKTSLIATFGTNILTDHEVDRKKLNKIVFNSKEAMKKLAEITWGYMEEVIEHYIKSNKDKAVILDYQLLPKTRFFQESDLKILVDADFELRKQRIIQRDGITEEKFLERENASLDFNKKDFDYIIGNNNFELTKGMVMKIYDKSIISRKF